MGKTWLTRDSPLATTIITLAAAWAIFAALVGIPLMFITALLVRLVFGCWDIRISAASRACIEVVVAKGAEWLLLAPFVVAGLTALWLTVRQRKKILEMFRSGGP